MPADPALVKQLAELVDGDSWQMADVLAERFPSDEWGEGSKAKSGLYDELVEHEDALRREYGIELKVNTMRIYRATALAWPHDMRVSSASFEAHKHLRGADRFQRMEHYLRLNGGNALSARAVVRYRTGEKPAPVVPAEVRLRRRVESTCKAFILGSVVTKRSDWWNLGDEEARDAVVTVLRDLAAAIEGR